MIFMCLSTQFPLVCQPVMRALVMPNSYATTVHSWKRGWAVWHLQRACYSKHMLLPASPLLLHGACCLPVLSRTYQGAAIVHVVQVSVGVSTEVQARSDPWERTAFLQTQAAFWRSVFIFNLKNTSMCVSGAVRRLFKFLGIHLIRKSKTCALNRSKRHCNI